MYYFRVLKAKTITRILFLVRATQAFGTALASYERTATVRLLQAFRTWQRHQLTSTASKKQSHVPTKRSKYYKVSTNTARCPL